MCLLIQPSVFKDICLSISMQIWAQVQLSVVNRAHFCLIFHQTVRERRKASEHTEAKAAEKMTNMKASEEDEDDPYSLCSAVDLDKVCVCVSVGVFLVWTGMCEKTERVFFYIQCLFVCFCWNCTELKALDRNENNQTRCVCVCVGGWWVGGGGCRWRVNSHQVIHPVAQLCQCTRILGPDQINQSVLFTLLPGVSV